MATKKASWTVDYLEEKVKKRQCLQSTLWRQYILLFFLFSKRPGDRRKIKYDIAT